MSEWTFTANAVPKGQPRARATRWGGGPRMWTPSTADAFKLAVADEARKAVEMDATPIRAGVALGVRFYMPRPKRLCGKRAHPGAIPAPVKPDLDNLLKAVMDALVNAGILHDDCIVHTLAATKEYAELDNNPRAEIKLVANTENGNG